MNSQDHTTAMLNTYTNKRPQVRRAINLTTIIYWKRLAMQRGLKLTKVKVTPHEVRLSRRELGICSPLKEGTAQSVCGIELEVVD